MQTPSTGNLGQPAIHRLGLEAITFRWTSALWSPNLDEHDAAPHVRSGRVRARREQQLEEGEQEEGEEQQVPAPLPFRLLAMRGPNLALPGLFTNEPCVPFPRAPRYADQPEANERAWLPHLLTHLRTLLCPWISHPGNARR